MSANEIDGDGAANATASSGSNSRNDPIHMQQGDGDMLEAHREDTERPVVKVLRDPEQPSREELDQHNICHLPYRAWCRHCVAGRGKAAQHRQIQDHDKALVTIATDYCFMGKKTDTDESDASTTAIILHKSDKGRWVLWTNM